jgi:hypothetical protein
MAADTIAWNLLAQEARGLLARLNRITPFALQETMVPAAALAPVAVTGIEEFLASGRAELRAEVQGYLRWLTGPGRAASPAELQRRFVLIRLRFNDVLSQYDMFLEVVTQRSEHETGVWLSGLDVAAADALDLGLPYYAPPPAVCYLARGPGAAIRRARTRLPGGGRSPVAIIRVPRERLVGHGIASSLVHEVGHQGAALLDLVPSLRPVLQRMQRQASPTQRPAWRAWQRWISEIVADYWSVGKLGISSTLGLLAVVSLPRFFVFRFSATDPHPIPWIRVLLSAAMGEVLYPHPQWQALARTWQQLYPLDTAEPRSADQLDLLAGSIPDFLEVLLGHRPAALRGRSLAEVMPTAERQPEQLLAEFERSAGRAEPMMRISATLAFAAIGQARAAGRIQPEREARLVGDLLTRWALASTLDIAAICAGGQPRPLTAGGPLHIPIHA